MAIKEGTLTNGGATVILKNESNETVVFTSFFHLERKEGGKWQGLPYTIDESIVAWEEIAYPLGGEYENELELAIEWEWLYETLDEGEYRLTKNYFLHDDYEKEFTVSVEFELE